jgi:hypothetical protein
MVKRVPVILLLILFCSALSNGEENNMPQEYQIKARYLLNMPLFAEIPAHANMGETYNICFIGDTPLERILKSSESKLIKNRPLSVKGVEDIDQMDSCQMLFIGSSERHRLQSLLSRANLLGILTISDMRDFAHFGGMISLLTVDNRVTFDLNRSIAIKAKIFFSSHLLKLARDVIN